MFVWHWNVNSLRKPSQTSFIDFLGQICRTHDKHPVVRATANAIKLHQHLRDTCHTHSCTSYRIVHMKTPSAALPS
eukprot:m.365049 g.365049  ORF g.365049 m.365049 type:complete len:76 (-) comp20811_c0_seq2:1174-1401(-)